MHEFALGFVVVYVCLVLLVFYCCLDTLVCSIYLTSLCLDNLYAMLCTVF